MIGVLIKNGLLLGLTLSISVGPLMLSIIKQSLSNGIKAGIAFIIGVLTSDITLVVLGNGFTELFRSVLVYKTPIGIAGGLLLIVLGLYAIFLKKAKANVEGLEIIKFKNKDLLKVFLSGYLINVLSPSAILFWVTVTTSFISYTLAQRIILFSICLGFVFLTDIIKVILAGRIRKKLTPHIIHIINIISGVIFIVFGVVLIWGLLVYKSTV